MSYTFSEDKRHLIHPTYRAQLHRYANLKHSTFTTLDLVNIIFSPC